MAEAEVTAELQGGGGLFLPVCCEGCHDSSEVGHALVLCSTCKACM
jgi:hypothetical protein